MSSLVKFLFSTTVFVIAVSILWYAYNNGGRQYIADLLNVPETTIYINSIPLEAYVANDQAERTQGLSGVTQLGDLEVLLFVFDEADYHGIWMKDMLIPIDVLWVDENFRIVYIEENMKPSSFPRVYRPNAPARFVIEGNAFFARSNSFAVGDEVQMPPIIVPQDLRNFRNLQ